VILPNLVLGKAKFLMKDICHHLADSQIDMMARDGAVEGAEKGLKVFLGTQGVSCYYGCEVDYGLGPCVGDNAHTFQLVWYIHTQAKERKRKEKKKMSMSFLGCLSLSFPAI